MMAVASMTGYGRGAAEGSGITVEVELSSVNRKQLDLRLTLPRGLAALEARVSKLVRSSISRGSISGVVRIGVSAAGGRGAVKVDMDLARAYVDALRKAGDELQLSDDLSMGLLTRLPDVVCAADAMPDSDKIWPLINRALKAALKALVEMRVSEGEALERDIRRRLSKLEKRMGQIAKLAPGVPRRYRKLLADRIEAAGIELSDDALAREVALFADRCDVSEELTRLQSHFAQADKLLNSSQPMGRAFDFLCQEFLREINTIGSKANDSRISHHVIAFKTELECVREQVQNIE
jgi:uncharacterized protein (TIGR00255 family)